MKYEIELKSAKSPKCLPRCKWVHIALPTFEGCIKDILHYLNHPFAYHSG